MELLKKNIRMTWLKGKGGIQTALEEDRNVPDSRPDAGSIIQAKGTIRTEEVRAGQGQVEVSGKLEVHILYVSDNEDHTLCRLQVELPFSETIRLEEAEPGNTIDLKKEIENLNVQLINSRKFSVRAVISLEAAVCGLYDAQAGVELHGAEGLCEKKRAIRPLSLTVQTRDILRIKEDLALASNKPNMAEILWESVQLRGTDTRVQDGGLEIRGELFIFLLYAADDEKRTKQWLETTVPFKQTLAAAGASETDIPDVAVTLSEVSVEIKADSDGEPRVAALEAVLDLEIRLYQEENVEILDDLYSIGKELVPIRKEESYESLVVRNFARCKAAERLRLEPKKPRMLQICHSRGEVKIDDASVVPGGVKVEGAVEVSILYVTADDAVPFAVMEGAVPFKQVIEAEGLGADCRFTLRAWTEQLGAAMIDSEEIEIKAGIDLHVLAVERHREAFLAEVEEKEPDLEKLQEMPSMTGYLVQPGDSLWEIAKEWRTTEERIRQMNHLEGETIEPGTRIILVKNVRELQLR